MIIVQGCTYLPATYLDKYSCLDSQTYGIDIIGVIDYSGHADSYIRFDCPQILSNINITIKGIDPKIIHPKKEYIVQDICCLPF